MTRYAEVAAPALAVVATMGGGGESGLGWGWAGLGWGWAGAGARLAADCRDNQVLRFVTFLLPRNRTGGRFIV